MEYFFKCFVYSLIRLDANTIFVMIIFAIDFFTTKKNAFLRKLYAALDALYVLILIM